MEYKLTPAETLSKEPKRWIATLIVALVTVSLIAWSGSALESNSTGGSGLSVAKGIILGILHPTTDILFTLQKNGVPYLLLETMCIAFLGTLVGAVISIPMAFLGAGNIQAGNWSFPAGIYILLYYTGTADGETERFAGRSEGSVCSCTV